MEDTRATIVKTVEEIKDVELLLLIYHFVIGVTEGQK